MNTDKCPACDGEKFEVDDICENCQESNDPRKSGDGQSLKAQLAAVEKELAAIRLALSPIGVESGAAVALIQALRGERDEAIDKAIDYMAACTKAETERDAAILRANELAPRVAVAEAERDAATGALAAAMQALRAWAGAASKKAIDDGYALQNVRLADATREILTSPAADLAARHDAEIERRALEKAAAVCEQRVIRETDTEERGHHVVDDWKYPIEGEEIASEIRALATPTPEKP